MRGLRKLAMLVGLPGLLAVPATGASQTLTDSYIAEPPYLYLDQAGYRAKRYRGPTPAEAPVGGTLDTEQLAALLAEHEDLLLVDVQPIPVRAEALEFGISWLPSEPRYHVPDSTWLPNVGAAVLDETMNAYFQRELARLSDRDKRRPLVFYCVLDCWMSWNATLRASRLGYTDVYWYREGTDGWEASGRSLVEAVPVELELE